MANHYQFTLPSMNCGSCIKRITSALLAIDPKAEINADLPTHRLTVTSDAAADPLRLALVQAGYPAREE